MNYGNTHDIIFDKKRNIAIVYCKKYKTEAQNVYNLNGCLECKCFYGTRAMCPYSRIINL